jgi:hypothetical protein
VSAPTYRDAKAHVASMPREQQEAYLRRVWAYRHDLELAGMPWSVLVYVAWLLGFSLVAFARALPGPELLPMGLGIAILLASIAFQRLAKKKRLAYEQAHPFKD